MTNEEAIKILAEAVTAITWIISDNTPQNMTTVKMHSVLKDIELECYNINETLGEE